MNIVKPTEYIVHKVYSKGLLSKHNLK